MRTHLVAVLLVGCGAAAVEGGAHAIEPTEEPAPATPANQRLALGEGYGCALLERGPRCWGAPPLEGVDPAEALDGAVEIDASRIRLCARFREGSVRCWDQDGTTPGSGTVTAPSIPSARRVWASGPPCALTEGDEIWCWNTARESVSFASPRAADEHDDGDLDAMFDGEPEEEEEEPPSFGRIATVPGAIDALIQSTSSFYVLEASGRLGHWSRDEMEESVVIDGAGSILRGRNDDEVLVLLDGDRTVRARFGRGDEVELEAGPTAVDVADAYPRACTIDASHHAVCSAAEGEAEDPSSIEVVGLEGMLAIAANDEQACVLTRADEVHCVDVRLPPRIVVLAAASTGLSEQGSTVCAEGAPWTCMLEDGRAAAWPAREANCVGASWSSSDDAPGPTSAGWTFCGNALRATLIDYDADGLRVVPIRGVRRVFRIESGLALSMSNGTMRLLPTDTGWGEYATLGAPLEGFSRLRDFNQAATHRCGVTASGTVRCQNANPRMTSAGFDITGIADAEEVETAAGCACARTASGGVQCVDFERDDASNPVRDTALSDIVELVGNNDQLCARSSDGNLWCSSDEFMDIPAAVQPTGSARCGAFLPTVLDDVVDIEAGVSFLCARESTGRVLCWGSLEEGDVARDIEGRLAPDRSPSRVAP